MRPALLVTVLLTLADCTLSARILAVLPFPGKSHFIYMSAILNALNQKGHHVVEYSPFPPSKPLPNYTHVEIHTSFEEGLKKWTYETFMKMVLSEQSMFSVGMKHVWEMTSRICEETFKLESIQKLLNSQEHFDLVITESTFGQESVLVFGHKFQAPTISLQGFGAVNIVNRAAGNTLSIATIPDLASLVTTDQMTFKERFINLMSTTLTLYSFYNYHLPNHERIVRQYYGDDAPSITDMVSNVSLYLINTHPAIEYTQPYTPNIVPIGGITITTERMPLPKIIQNFMDDAKEGVIYFSLGTVVPAHLLPKELLQIFINVFKKLKYKVLWKIELENIPGIPENVLLTKWVPQPGVLAHPNCAVFMTHGGMLSQQEAIHAGVPTVGIPFFADQPYNVRLNEHHGIGVKLDFKTLSEETVTSALNTVLQNSKYKKNTQVLSQLYRDRINEPADTVLFWVEYVIRHRGAHHLRSEAARLAWYQLTLLDIVAAALVAILIVLTTLYIIISRLLRIVFSKKQQADVLSQKKNN